jgi:predicted O-linked N-acetylglucosamine transferase (SPINDLY family)
MNARIHMTETDIDSYAIGGFSLSELFAHAENLQKNDKLLQVEQLYEEWLSKSSDPYKYAAYFNYGSLLQKLDKQEKAESAYRNAIALQPKFAQAIINLGLLLEKRNMPDAAIEQWSSIVAYGLQKQPVSVEFQVIALNHIGRLQESLRQYDLAEDALSKSLHLDPKQPGVIQHWVHIRQKACNWPVFQELPGISVNKQMMSTSPLAMLALYDDPLMQLLSATAFVARTYNIKEEFLFKEKKYRHKRIRIGYLSGDLCVHAVGLLLADFFEGHNREKFEIYAYDYSVEDGTAHRERLKNAFEHFRNIKNISDREAAKLICSDEIDILIDMHGLSNGARPGITALHPAPHQGTYIGFIGTTALPWLDFVIIDRYVLPEKNIKFITEKPLYIDDSFIPLNHEPLPNTRFTRAELGLPENSFVMASFSNIYKINPALFECWMTILRKIDNSILWLLDDNDAATSRLKTEAKSQGISNDRIIFSKRTGHGEYRSRLLLADIYLDSYPYNCGSTARDVLDIGLPMITISGNSMVSRMAGSMLKSAGLDDLITENFKEYEECAVNLFLNPEKLEAYKSILINKISNRKASSKKLVKSVENQYLNLIK